ncbi:hypothetical protein [Stackebrandtia nassauensis]|uniref:DUF4878 domain-containing protein n=1 Tax=Stackebrandtia nassauensis (strain DSM 44728 / CIP 108903 / NRRL B-16338 / NBRC 102104 / LLR-40K-21) TaxID=446470 RepID=D3Q715_STANL|nr:hypothetical protein [Stackebrandtia nassauensis]ADD40414.1 hypothetical protein Snas_0701 [Stackebrandtia nassauensis DSM 44728]
MSQHGPHGGYPDQGPSGYPQYSPSYYSQPVTGAQPVTGMPMMGAAPQQPQPDPRPRGPLKFLVPLCVVLALAFGGSAYFFFISGDAPSEVVGQYITHAQDEDFAGAREFTSDSATKATKFQGNSEGMETMRRWFGEDTMRWEVRGDSTSGSKSTVTVDKTLVLPNYDEPVEMRWDYRLERESGNWKIDRVKIMSIVDDGIAGPGDCMLATGFAYEAADCSDGPNSEASVLVEVTDAVDVPDDCPNPTGPAVETTKKRILCIEEQSPESS